MMKSLSPLLCGLVLLSTMPVVFAEAPAEASPPSVSALVHKPLDKPAPPASKKDKDGKPAPTPPPTPTPVSATPKLDDYIVELTAALDLSDAEKKEVHDLYTADGTALQNILNDNSLSPLQKAQQVSDLRDVRNGKIEDLLHDIDRQHAFLQVEAVYRVSLTVSAANGGLGSAPSTPPPTPVPGASPTPVVAPAKSDDGAGMTSGASPSQPAPTTPSPATNTPVETPPPAK